MTKLESTVVKALSLLWLVFFILLLSSCTATHRGLNGVVHAEFKETSVFKNVVGFTPWDQHYHLVGRGSLDYVLMFFDTPEPYLDTTWDCDDIANKAMVDLRYWYAFKYEGRRVGTTLGVFMVMIKTEGGYHAVLAFPHPDGTITYIEPRDKSVIKNPVVLAVLAG